MPTVQDDEERQMKVMLVTMLGVLDRFSSYVDCNATDDDSRAVADSAEDLKSEIRTAKNAIKEVLDDVEVRLRRA